jgi:type III secretory pathway lipoprotein EscJ
MKKLICGFLIYCCICLSGCNNVRVAEDVSQTEANQIISELSKHGIYAVSTKTDATKPKYHVEVNNSFYTQAKSILVEKSLPKEGDKASFVDLVEARGLLPNSREIEGLRLDHAMAVELEEALNTHPDIAGAKVVIRSHETETGSGRAVSVIIQEKADRTIDQANIKEIVKKTVPGLSDENIILTVGKASSASAEGGLVQHGVQEGSEVFVPLTHFLFNWQVPEADYNAIVIVLIICFFVIAILGWMMGFWYGYFRNTKHIIEGGLPDLTMRNLRLDRPERGPTSEI